MVFHRLILNAIKKSLTSGRALMACLPRQQVGVDGGPVREQIYLSICDLKVRQSTGKVLGSDLKRVVC